MGKLLVGILSAIGGFMLTSSLFGPAGGEARVADGSADAIYQDARFEGCMRQIRQHTNSESIASSTCTCIYSEFDERGLGLTDAFGSDFGEMSVITRDCATRYGVAVAPPEGW